MAASLWGRDGGSVVGACCWPRRPLALTARASLAGDANAKDEGVATMCVGVTLQSKTGVATEGVMVTQWPSEVKERFDGSNKYMKALLECSPYPLCLFNFNGQLITCNPAAKAVFGDTIWLQSDIFGMSERERRGLQERNETGLLRERSGLEPAEHTERCSAYEAMMEELVEDGSSYQTDLLIRRQSTTAGPEEFW
jgi:PAS domain-containing protein